MSKGDRVSKRTSVDYKQPHNGGEGGGGTSTGKQIKLSSSQYVIKQTTYIVSKKTV